MEASPSRATLFPSSPGSRDSTGVNPCNNPGTPKHKSRHEVNKNNAKSWTQPDFCYCRIVWQIGFNRICCSVTWFQQIIFFKPIFWRLYRIYFGGIDPIWRINVLEIGWFKHQLETVCCSVCVWGLWGYAVGLWKNRSLPGCNRHHQDDMNIFLGVGIPINHTHTHTYTHRYIYNIYISLSLFNLPICQKILGEKTT